jgi:hypothetical protein
LSTTIAAPSKIRSGKDAEIGVMPQVWGLWRAYTSFVILKAIAFDQRTENKDAGDLVHVMRYAGTPDQVGEEIVGRYRSGEHNQAILDALVVLQNRFCDGDGVEGYLRTGPIAAARFKLGLDPDDDDDRVREQRDVAGLVAEIVAYVQGRIQEKDAVSAYAVTSGEA